MWNRKKKIYVSVVTARGCKCSGSVLNLLVCVCTRANNPQQFSGKVSKMQLVSALSHWSLMIKIMWFYMLVTTKILVFFLLHLKIQPNIFSIEIYRVWNSFLSQNLMYLSFFLNHSSPVLYLSMKYPFLLIILPLGDVLAKVLYIL